MTPAEIKRKVLPAIDDGYRSCGILVEMLLPHGNLNSTSASRVQRLVKVDRNDTCHLPRTRSGS